MVGGVTVATTAIEVGCGWVVGGWGEGVGLSGRTRLVFFVFLARKLTL